MSYTYLTLEQAIEIHAKTVEVSGGGAMGHLDVGKLDSVLHHIQNDIYYPTFEEKLTHLFSVRANFIALRMATNVSPSRFPLRCCFLTDISVIRMLFFERWKT